MVRQRVLLLLIWVRTVRLCPIERTLNCCLAVPCWEWPDLLALVGDVYCIFVTFPCGILGQVGNLILSFPDICRLSYVVWNNLLCTENS